MGTRPKVVSLFSGCGGSSLGYRWAGYDELLAIDFDKNSVETFKLNFPEVEVWRKDIMDISGQEIMDFCGIKKGELDVLDASPPCQGFSMAGKRKVMDDRNDLTMEFVRLLEEISPRVFLMENVPGMIRGKMKGRYIEIVGRIKENYDVVSAILDASYYGVPQARKRLIIIGTRKGTGMRPSFPKMGRRTVVADDQALGDMLAINTGQFSRVWKDFTHPSPTLMKTRSLYCLGKDNKTRKITIDEAKVICSFPREFKLMGSESQQWARLGNSVMPRFMHRLAKHIKEEVLG